MKYDDTIATLFHAIEKMKNISAHKFGVWLDCLLKGRKSLFGHGLVDDFGVWPDSLPV
jgi:hypothetical protein